jgi:hypothetical protein
MKVYKSINPEQSLGVHGQPSGLIVVQMYPCIPDEEKIDEQKMRVLLTTDEAKWLVSALKDLLYEEEPHDA